MKEQRAQHCNRGKLKKLEAAEKNNCNFVF